MAAINAATAYAFQVVGNVADSGTLGNVFGHAVVGCASAEAQGGDCGQGAASGAVGAIASDLARNQPQYAAFAITVTAGGTAASLSGGKFSDGAMTAALGYLFNYLMHLDAAPAKSDPRGMPVLMYVDDKAHTQFTGFLMDLQDWGIDVKITDAFRTNGMQALLSGNTYGGAAYGSSLHEAGFAIDINWNRLNVDQQKFALERANAWGVKWGGGFRPYDPVHFYVDPFKNRQQRTQAIRDAQQEFMGGR